MEIAILSVIFIIATFIFIKSVKSVRREKFENQVLCNGNLPDGLGVRDGLSLEPVVSRLEESLDNSHVDQVKHRLIKKGLLKEEEFHPYFFELKRFFILASILKHTPMYNEKVDTIWHEMIMFTKEYKQFCEAFAGEMIHHTPNSIQLPRPEERAWFEWVYTQLFTHLPYTTLMYGRFFNGPLSQQTLKYFENANENELQTTYFRKSRSEEIKRVQHALIDKMKQSISTTQSLKPDKKAYLQAKKEEDATMLAYIMLYYSLYSEDADDFQMNMDTLEIDLAAGTRTSNQGSSFHGGGDSSGGDASSGASCGGGGRT